MRLKLLYTYMYVHVYKLYTCRLDKALSKIELDNGLQTRVDFDSPSFKELQYQTSIIHLNQLKKKIENIAREQWFLFVLKAKFAGTYY